jgi:hypothetical protein
MKQGLNPFVDVPARVSRAFVPFADHGVSDVMSVRARPRGGAIDERT